MFSERLWPSILEGGVTAVSTVNAPAVGTLACLSSLFPLCLSISPCPMTLIQATDLWDQDL